jgi:exonuclease III
VHAAVVVVPVSTMSSDQLLRWNVHGMNAKAHKDAVRALVQYEHILFVCLQETKLAVISDFDIMQILGAGFEYFYLPAVQTKGNFGRLVAIVIRELSV